MLISKSCLELVLIVANSALVKLARNNLHKQLLNAAPSGVLKEIPQKCFTRAH